MGKLRDFQPREMNDRPTPATHLDWVSNGGLVLSWFEPANNLGAAFLCCMTIATFQPGFPCRTGRDKLGEHFYITREPIRSRWC
jgi:hypothetical protein